MRTTARGISLVTLLSMMLAVLALSPAFAQQANPYEETGTTDEAVGPTSVPPGRDATFWAPGFEPGTPAFVTVTGVLSETATVTVDEQGVATYVVEVPCDATSGDATITFEGAGDDGQPLTSTTEFTVTQTAAAACPAPEADDRALAATGGEFTNGAVIAVLALLVGAGFLIVGRRRSNESIDA